MAAGPKCRPDDPEHALEQAAASRGRLIRGKTTGSKEEDLLDTDMVNLYCFGVAHDIPDLGNAALSLLAARNERLQCTASAVAVEQAFATQPSNPKLCAYLGDEGARRLHAGNVPSYLVKYPGPYVQRILQKKLAKGSIQEKMQSANWLQSICHFHFHTSSNLQQPCVYECAIPGNEGGVAGPTWYVIPDSQTSLMA